MQELCMDCKEKILSDDYRDFIADASLPINTDAGLDLCEVSLDGLYRLLYVNRTGLPPILDNPNEYQITPKVYGLLPVAGGSSNAPADTLSLTAAGITQVQRPPLSLTGRGVIVAYIGSGVDYREGVFRDSEGASRILTIWDQTVQEGEPPEGFLFGTEYSAEEINRALAAEDPFMVVPSVPDADQGNVLLAVAAGSRTDEARAFTGGEFVGAAPDAQLLAVRLKPCKPHLREYYLLPQEVPAYEEQDIMLALQYVDQVARKRQQPAVIVLGLGTNLGSHSGSSPLALYLNSIAVKRDRAIVVPGGDEGNASHHYAGSLLLGRVGEDAREGRSYQDVEVRVGAGNRGFLMEFWGGTPDRYQVEIRSPGGEMIPMPPPGLGESVSYRFIYEKSVVTVSVIPIEPVTGDELILFRIEEPTEGIWNFRVAAQGRIFNGFYHMWLPISEFLTAETYFLRPDPFTTLTEPAMTVNAVAVTAYNDRNNSFSIESGRGFSRIGQIRPDFAAPGVNVSTPFGRRSGTALAGALTAGAIAQFLQWSLVERYIPYTESKEVKNYLIRGAYRETDRVYPNREWGYGRLNLAGAFDVLADL